MPQAGRQEKGILAILLSPTVFWLVLFFVAPLMVVLVVSFGKRSLSGVVEYTFSLDNYIRVFSEPIYLRILWKSVWLAVAWASQPGSSGAFRDTTAVPFR